VRKVAAAREAYLSLPLNKRMEGINLAILFMEQSRATEWFNQIYSRCGDSWTYGLKHTFGKPFITFLKSNGFDIDGIESIWQYFIQDTVFH